MTTTDSTNVQAAGAAQDDTAQDDQEAGRAADQFPNLVAFVHGWLVPVYRRRVADGRHRTWCPTWWEHPEAMIRLAALWRSFEQAHQSGSPAEMSNWLRDHLDMHMAQLTDPDGPLKGCNIENGHADHPLEPWPIAQPPARLAGNTTSGNYQTLITDITEPAGPGQGQPSPTGTDR